VINSRGEVGYLKRSGRATNFVPFDPVVAKQQQDDRWKMEPSRAQQTAAEPVADRSSTTGGAAFLPGRAAKQRAQGLTTPDPKLQQQFARGVASVIPGVSSAADVYDAYRSAKAGEYGKAALQAGAAGLGVVPGVAVGRAIAAPYRSARTATGPSRAASTATKPADPSARDIAAGEVSGPPSIARPSAVTRQEPTLTDPNISSAQATRGRQEPTGAGPTISDIGVSGQYDPMLNTVVKTPRKVEPYLSSSPNIKTGRKEPDLPTKPRIQRKPGETPADAIKRVQSQSAASAIRPTSTTTPGVSINPVDDLSPSTGRSTSTIKPTMSQAAASAISTAAAPSLPTTRAAPTTPELQPARSTRAAPTTPELQPARSTRAAPTTPELQPARSTRAAPTTPELQPARSATTAPTTPRTEPTTPKPEPARSATAAPTTPRPEPTTPKSEPARSATVSPKTSDQSTEFKPQTPSGGGVGDDVRLRAMQYLSGLRPDASGKVNPNPPGINPAAWSPEQLSQYNTVKEHTDDQELNRIMVLSGR
jgi:hypothetical protein